MVPRMDPWGTPNDSGADNDRKLPIEAKTSVWQTWNKFVAFSLRCLLMNQSIDEGFVVSCVKWSIDVKKNQDGRFFPAIFKVVTNSSQSSFCIVFLLKTRLKFTKNMVSLFFSGILRKIIILKSVENNSDLINQDRTYKCSVTQP